MATRRVTLTLTSAEAWALYNAARAGEGEWCAVVMQDPDASLQQKTADVATLARAMEKFDKALPN